jgi:alkyl sulfatase BDS1-like metallo-beta-lactamase superfamily hydrolase
MNPINYAVGLVDEIGFAQATKDKAREAAARTELQWALDEMNKVDADKLSEHTRHLLADAKQAATDALANKPKRAAKAADAPAEG